jgi:Family of unknown function (DUF6459)
VLPLVPDLGRPPDQDRPLPDATAVRRLAVPDSAPPYDDEFQAAGRSRAVPAGNGRPGPDGTRNSDSTRNPGRTRNPAGGWPGKFAQVLAETLAGSRPPRQIVPWTTEEARRHIRRLGPMLAAGQQPLVHRVIASRPAENVVEMTVVVRFGPRVRALAVRLERDGPPSAGPPSAEPPTAGLHRASPYRAEPGRGATPARWRCTAVEAA